MKAQTSVANGMTWFAPVVAQRKVVAPKKERVIAPTMRLYQYKAGHTTLTSQGIALNAVASKQLHDVIRNGDASVMIGADKDKLILQVHPHQLGFKIKPKGTKKNGNPSSYVISFPATVMNELKALGFNPKMTLPFSFEKNGNSLIATRV